MKKSLLSRAGLLALTLILTVSMSGCALFLPFFAILDSLPEPDDGGFEGGGGNDRLFFWEVTHPDYEGRLYLLGSIHLADESIYPLGDRVMSAYDRAGSVAVEVDVVAMESDIGLLTELSELMIYPGGGKVTEHMPAELYKRAKNFLKENDSYVITMDYMRPMAWSSVIDEVLSEGAGLSADFGVDRYFTNLAKEDAKEIIEIETAADQYRLLMSVPDELAFFLIGQSLDGEYAVWMQYAELYEKWREGDVEWFEQYIRSTDGVPANLLPLMEEYYDSLLDGRNVNMANRAMEILRSGRTCFYIAGAAHMIGPAGVVAILAEQGCGIVRQSGASAYLRSPGPAASFALIS